MNERESRQLKKEVTGSICVILLSVAGFTLVTLILLDTIAQLGLCWTSLLVSILYGVIIFILGYLLLFACSRIIRMRIKYPGGGKS